MTDEQGLLAGRYRISRQLGRGGMGTVWLAQDELLDRPVAVKKLHVAPQLEEDDRTRLHERTRREARSAARISHPGVIVVHDVVEEEGRPCIVMEYVPSRSLGEVLREDGPLAPQDAAGTGAAMASALRAAHAAGVLHRDVKPANVLLSSDQERVVLTDFGIAAASGTATLTRTGEFVGSVNYAAPERMQGGEAGPAADAWALGATLYEAVEGVAPFRRSTWMETAYAVASEPPRPMERAGPLAELIEGLLEKEAVDRLSLARAEEWLSGAAGTVALPSSAPWAGRAASPERQNGERPYGGGAADARDEDAPDAVAVATARYPDRSRAPEEEPHRAAGRDGANREHAGPPGEPSEPPAAARRRGLRAAVWVSCAALIAAAVLGGALWLRNGPDAGAGQGSPSKPASPSSSASGPGPRPPVADGYKRVDDELGFSVDVPENWTRQESQGGQQVDYVSPSRRTGLKFSVLDFADGSPLRHWRRLEPEVREKSPGYRNLRMNATTYQGKKAAIWEYAWRGRKRPYRAVDLGFGDEGGRHYAIYLSSPEAQWAASKPYFDMAVKTFRAGPGGEREK